ncbi:hypothetical protein HDU92_003250 [Lobulomyces angularis]|nr:hypothetical protein HDU92_003250 [Lobulomyces angularis]
MKFLALGLSFISGMGTLLGGVLLLIFLKTREHSSMHSISLDPILFSKLLAVSAGVMLLLSLDLIVLESLPSLGLLATSFYTALGSLFFVIIQKFLPGEIYNKKNLKKKLNLQSNIDEKIAAVLIDSNNIETTKSKKLLRTTLVTFFAMASHNLPEGISVAFTTDADLQLGISLCIAILLHNVLEGMIVALPIFASTNSTKKVIIWTFINGLMEPFGVIMAYSLSFTLSWDPTDFNYIHKTLAAVGGVMAGITLMELIPSSLTYNKNNSFQVLKYLFFGFVFGFFILFFSNLIQNQLN